MKILHLLPTISPRWGGPNQAVIAMESGLHLKPWARRWGLMVLKDWLQRHLGVELEAG